MVSVTVRLNTLRENVESKPNKCGIWVSDVSELRELDSEVTRKVGMASGERELVLQHNMYLEKSWKQPRFWGEFRLKSGEVLLFSKSQCQRGVEGPMLRLWSVHRHWQAHRESEPFLLNKLVCKVAIFPRVYSRNSFLQLCTQLISWRSSSTHSGPWECSFH